MAKFEVTTRRRTWTSIATAVAVGGGVLILAVGVRVVVVVYEHIQERSVTPEEAETKLALVRERLAGRQALLEVRDGSDPIIRRESIQVSGPAVKTLRAVIYDAPSGRIIEDDVPFSVLRFLKSGGFRYLGELTPMHGDTDFERDLVNVALEDIERHRNLILDHSHATGSQIVVWVE